MKERVFKPAHVQVFVHDFVRSHGKAPRGEGNWAFCKVSPSRADYLDHVLWEVGSYGAAKKAAQAKACAEGVEVLYVCS